MTEPTPVPMTVSSEPPTEALPLIPGMRAPAVHASLAPAGPEPLWPASPPAVAPVVVAAPVAGSLLPSVQAWAEHSKFVAAVIGLAITFASQYYGTNHWVSAAVAAASALGVYAVPNRQGTAHGLPLPPGGPE